MANMKFKTMKAYRKFMIYGIVVFTAIFASCEDDVESNAGNAAIAITQNEQSIKAPGNGQFKTTVYTSEQVTVAAALNAAELKSLTVTKTVNLAVDTQFGQNGTLTVNLSSFTSAYAFSYTGPTSEIGKLVAFTFRAEKKDGTVLTSDLTVNVTLSPRDNLPTKRWNWKSRLWTDGGNLEDIKECEKDNYFLFNADGSMSAQYGAPGCPQDLVVYYTWVLSDDEKTLTITRNGDPAMQVCRVKVLTTERLDIEMDYDLSIFGLSTEETFLYKLEAAPR
jgi:hypothetical protein